MLLVIRCNLTIPLFQQFCPEGYFRRWPLDRMLCREDFMIVVSGCDSNSVSILSGPADELQFRWLFDCPVSSSHGIGQTVHHSIRGRSRMSWVRYTYNFITCPPVGPCRGTLQVVECLRHVDLWIYVHYATLAMGAIPRLRQRHV